MPRIDPIPFALLAMVAVLASPILVLPRAASGTVDGFRAKLEKWVETQRITAEERSDWDVERETLRATRDLLKEEKEALEAEIAELEAGNTGADEERRDLLLERGGYQRVNLVLAEQVRGMEERVLAVLPRLPEPLRKKLDPLVVQIPADPEHTNIQLGQRLMNVLGVLSQAEKWNGTATFVGETRAVGGDQKMQVRTLYWGLGQAFYVDAQGRTAGVGRPGPNGWEFSDEPSLAGDTELLLDIYEGNVDRIDFVGLPVEIR